MLETQIKRLKQQRGNLGILKEFSQIMSAYDTIDVP